MHEEEGDLCFEGPSGRVITDDVFSRLLTFPTVFVTAFAEGRTSRNEVRPQTVPADR